MAQYNPMDFLKFLPNYSGDETPTSPKVGGFFQQPEISSLGLGLLAASGQQPAGTDRMALLAPYLQQGMKAGQAQRAAAQKYALTAPLRAAELKTQLLTGEKLASEIKDKKLMDLWLEEAADEKRRTGTVSPETQAKGMRFFPKQVGERMFPELTETQKNYKEYVDTVPKGETPISMDNWNLVNKMAEQGYYLGDDGSWKAFEGSKAYLDSPEGKAAIKEAELAIVEKQKLETRLPAVIRENQELINYTDRLPDLFNRIIKLSSKNTTGGIFGKSKMAVVGTDQYKLNKLIGELQSFVGLNRLIAVKKAGGTFGSLSENELKLLIDALGSLDPLQTHETTMKTLENIHQNYNDSMTVAKTTFVQEYGEDKWNKASWNTKVKGVTQYKLLPPLGAVKVKS